MIKADPEYYQSLQKELTMQGRWFTVASFGFMFCIGLALEAGLNGGWPWLLGSLVALLFVLWARIDQQTTRVLIQIYLTSAQ